MGGIFLSHREDLAPISSPLLFCIRIAKAISAKPKSLHVTSTSWSVPGSFTIISKNSEDPYQQRNEGSNCPSHSNPARNNPRCPNPNTRPQRTRHQGHSGRLQRQRSIPAPPTSLSSLLPPRFPLFLEPTNRSPDWDHLTSQNISLNSGDDLAGIVHSIGSDVARTCEFKEGDRVAVFHPMMAPHGAFAEYAVAPAATVFKLAEGVSFEGT